MCVAGSREEWSPASPASPTPPAPPVAATSERQRVAESGAEHNYLFKGRPLLARRNVVITWRCRSPAPPTSTPLVLYQNKNIHLVTVVVVVRYRSLH